jgi:hypothetical protein
MGSIYVDASTERVERDASIPSSGLVSMAAWFKVTGTIGDYKVIAQIGTAYAARYIIDVSTTYGGISLEAGAGDRYTPSGNTVSEDAWYYAAFAVSGTGAGNVSVYLWDDTGALLCSTTGNGASFTPAYMFFGGSNIANRHLDGLIAQGRIWDAALSQSEFESELRNTSVQRSTGFNSGFFDSVSGVAPQASRSWTDYSTSYDADTPPVGATNPILLRPRIAVPFKFSF